MTKHCKESAAKMKEVICPVCGRKFKRKVTSNKRYCSDKCRKAIQDNTRTSNEVWQARANALRRATNNLPTELANEGYKHIQAAVVQQAVYDYAAALNNGNSSEILSLERWFLSEWGQAYAEGNGQRIIERVRAECGKKRKRVKN